MELSSQALEENDIAFQVNLVNKSKEDSHNTSELSWKQLKINQEKIYQATNKLDSLTGRCQAENKNLDKEIEELKLQVGEITHQFNKTQK